MVSLMGPPPKSFIEKSEKCLKYWDTEGERQSSPVHTSSRLTAKGNWIAATPIPEQSLESREKRLNGKDKELLLQYVRRVLRWNPEDRPSAQDLFELEFLTQFQREEAA